MPYAEPFDDPSRINIQEIPKNYEKEVLRLRRSVFANTLTGKALRVLIGRLKRPERPYSSVELQVLLLLTLAEEGKL